MTTPPPLARVVIVPDNGCAEVDQNNWYSWARDTLIGINAEVILRNMPDPHRAREQFWLPFMYDTLQCDDQTIIVGHGSGAAAAMRYAEKYRVRGLVLVAAYSTDLGVDSERESGYFDRPWEWARIRENTRFVIQLGSDNDPFVPWEEQEKVAVKVKADMRKFTDKGHFMAYEFPDLIAAVRPKFYIKYK